VVRPGQTPKCNYVVQKFVN